MIDRVMLADERILWEGKPHRLAYAIGNVSLYFFALIWTGLLFNMSRMFNAMYKFPFHEEMNGTGSFFPFLEMESSSGFFAMPGLMFRLVFLGMLIFPLGIFLSPIYRFFNWKGVNYYITNKQCYLTSGITGRNLTSLSLSSLWNVDVYPSFMDRLLNTKTVRLSPDQRTSYGEHARTIYGPRFHSIPDAYEVVQLIKTQQELEKHS